MAGEDAPGRPNLEGWWRAIRQLPGAVASRWRARSLAVVDDTEAFHRPLGGYYRDRFPEPAETGTALRVLFVSPYPICPPVHGGGVFMYQTALELTRLSDLHLLILLGLLGIAFLGLHFALFHAFLSNPAMWAAQTELEHRSGLRTPGVEGA